MLQRESKDVQTQPIVEVVLSHLLSCLSEDGDVMG